MSGRVYYIHNRRQLVETAVWAKGNSCPQRGLFCQQVEYNVKTTKADGYILDSFVGSGMVVMAAVLEVYSATGISANWD